MGTEKVKFKLELYATMWDKPPHAEILINNQRHFDGAISGTIDKPNIIEFEDDLEEGGHNLIINRSGKSKGQTVITDNGDILKDQLLHIKGIEIDEIDLGALVYHGVYTPQYPEPWASQQHESGVSLQESFRNVTVIGHDGEWRFSFASPFYTWLLENLY
jgi:hypothetical protein